MDMITFSALLGYLNIDYCSYTSSHYDLTFISFSYVPHVLHLSLISVFQIYIAVHACLQPELTAVTLPFEHAHVKTQPWHTRRFSQKSGIRNSPSLLPGKQLSGKLMEENYSSPLLNLLDLNLKLKTPYSKAHITPLALCQHCILQIKMGRCAHKAVAMRSIFVLGYWEKE